MEAQNLVKLGEIDRAIIIYQRLKQDSGRILHLIGLLYAEKKGDYHSATNYYQQALEIQEEDLSQALIYAQQALTLNQSIRHGNEPHIAANLAILANIYHH